MSNDDLISDRSVVGIWSRMVVVIGVPVIGLGISLFTSFDQSTWSHGRAGGFYAGIMTVLAGVLGVFFTDGRDALRLISNFAYSTAVVIFVAMIIDIMAGVKMVPVLECMEAEEATSNFPFAPNHCEIDLFSHVFSSNDCICDMRSVDSCKVVTMSNGHSCDEITGSLIPQLIGSIVLLSVSFFVVLLYAGIVNEVWHRESDAIHPIEHDDQPVEATATRVASNVPARRSGITPVAIPVPHNPAAARQPSSSLPSQQPTRTTTTTHTTENITRQTTTTTTTEFS